MRKRWNKGNVLPTRSIDPILGSVELTGLSDHEKIIKIADVLKHSSSSLFQKIGKDNDTLRTIKIPPQEYPGWTNDKSFPLRVIVDASDTSLANFKSQAGAKEDTFNIERPTGQRLQGIGINNNGVQFNIHLGIPDGLIERNGEIAAGLLLAKEHVTHALIVQMAKEFSLHIHERMQGNIVDYSGKRITD